MGEQRNLTEENVEELKKTLDKMKEDNPELKYRFFPNTADLTKRFTYHPPKENQPHRYTLIRERGLGFALMIDEQCPDSREKALALTKLEEAVMWANAAIARNE